MLFALLRERLAADPTEGEQTGPSPEEDVRTLWSLLTSMDSGGKNGSKSAERSSPTPLTMVGVNTIGAKRKLTIHYSLGN